LMTSLPANDPIRVDAANRYPLIPKPFSAADLAAFMTMDNSQ